jgi:uncharacterized protein
LTRQTGRRTNNRMEIPAIKADSVATQDGYQNLLSRIGSNSGNIVNSGTYSPTFMTKNWQQLSFAYRTNWICQKVIVDYADDMTRAGITIKGKNTPEEISALDEGMVDLGLWEGLNNLIRWGRLYGGAVAVIEIEGQAADTPLRVETIGRGQFKGLTIYDRWQLVPDLNTPIMLGPDAGMPSFYGVNTDYTLGQTFRRVHHSRCLRFIGVKLPHWEEIREMMWGISVYEGLEDRLQAYNEATGGAANLLSMAYLRTISVEGLREILAGGGQAETNLARNFEYVRMLQNIMGITLLDKSDTFQTSTYTFSGVPEMLREFGQQISGATGIPLVRLFGQSPAGLSATGESDLRNYYDTINAYQNATLKRSLKTVIRCLHRSVLGTPEPLDFGFEFKPLWQMSAEQKANIANVKTTAILAAHEGQVIGAGTAMTELRQMADETGMFSNITEEQIADAQDVPPPTPETAESVSRETVAPPVIGVTKQEPAINGEQA